MKKTFFKTTAVCILLAMLFSCGVSSESAYRSEKDTVLFAGVDNENLNQKLWGDSEEMQNAYSFRIPSLVNTGKALVAAADNASSSADWGDINIAVRTSSDNGRTWSSPIESILTGPKNDALLGAKHYSSAFYIDPLMVTAQDGSVLLMADFWPECKGLHEKKFLEDDLPAYTRHNGNTYLNLYAGKSALDGGKAEPGDAYTVRENGWVYSPEGKKTNYYLPQNHSAEFSYQTIGDLYYAVGEADYVSHCPPLVPDRPEGEKDIYAGNVYLSSGKPELVDGTPAFVQKMTAGDSEKTGKKYDTQGDYECTVTDAAPLRCAVKNMLFVAKSTDNGETWSQPLDVTGSVYQESDGAFLGTAPGSGITLRYQKDSEVNGRIIMPVYALDNAAVIYSDDNGESWKRADGYINNIDEWQPVEQPDGTLMSFGRQYEYGATPVSYSIDGGVTWSVQESTGLFSVRCQKSVVAYPIGSQYLPDTLDASKQYVISSHPSGSKENPSERANGKITLGEVQSDNTVKWLYERTIALDNQYDFLDEYQNFFAYSSMAVLNNGNIGVFYEAQPHSYLTFTEFNLEWIMQGDGEKEIQNNASEMKDIKQENEKKQKNKKYAIIGVSVGGTTIVCAAAAIVIIKTIRKKKSSL